MNPESVRCPQCHAEPGEPCTIKRLRAYGRTAHLSRQDAAMRANRAQRKRADDGAMKAR
ncbi:hypothetical protein [Antrihabitans stalactiti]|uniref:zinc finger domain-containing protein n=1 Tax=Antrihabitans stalactiti TaxID=2584121 RepID=UPI001469D7FF|nr:hypothetical protein [Antrihabitans stalactiti]